MKKHWAFQYLYYSFLAFGIFATVAGGFGLIDSINSGYFELVSYKVLGLFLIGIITLSLHLLAKKLAHNPSSQKSSEKND